MGMIGDKERLSVLVAELNEEAVLEAVRQHVADGVDPLAIIDLCHKGMVQVGELYNERTYFISGLIMAGEIMRKVSQVVLPLIENKSTNGDAGRIVLGTVEGDIHFIGKDIFRVLVRAHGFAVHDLGVDVPPSRFLSAVHEFKPDIVGLSCLISGAFNSVRETIALLREEAPDGPSPRAYIIGGRVDELISKELGADYWANDAMKGVLLCQKVMHKDRAKR
jgi:methanogenic corrinoid protein MtbC1